MSGLLRRMRGGPSVEDEREMLRHAQESAARQLDAMKHELAERVQAIRDRERALDHALGEAPSQPLVPLPHVDGDAAEVAQRERALAEREELVARREHELGASPVVALAATTDEQARIEQRLADLREAEKLFLQTQSELASRSEAVAARERLVSGREREAGGANRQPDRIELAEHEARLPRPERPSASSASDNAASFAGGLESLRRRGTRRRT